MKKLIPFFQNQSNTYSKRSYSLSKMTLTMILLMCLSTVSFSQTVVDCAAGPVNTTYCYVDNDTTQFVFTNTDGFP